MKFIVFSQFGEIADLAIHLEKVEGHEVLFYVPEKDCHKIADGILTHISEWYRYIGQGYVWVFDSCSYGDLQDWLREQGEAVFGGCKAGDELENDRQAGQDWFTEAGFDQVESQNFTDFESATEFVKEHADERWILKQNGSAPKHLSHMGKFDGSEDMIYHLEFLKKSWNESQYGAIDFDLMQVVEGLEVAASAFFNGADWMRQDGKVCGFLNFEEKKEANGNTGETTGEMGTTFWGCTEDNELFREIICPPEMAAKLKEIGFRGVFDINCIVTDDRKIVALEPTCRFGVPATSYEFCEGLRSGTGALLEAVAKGKSTPVKVTEGWGMVMVIAAKPFPIETDDANSTSIDEKLWILKDGEPVKDFGAEQWKHIHLYNFCKEDDGYKVATKSGYLLTVTATGESISEIREGLIEYVKDNISIAGQKYRTDIGARVEEYEKELTDEA